MNGTPSDRTAIVTGAAQGVGAGIARALHAAGHPLLLCDINGAAAQSLADQMAADGGAPVRAFQVDVRNKAEVQAMVTAAISWQGNVSVLVNNAARTVAREFMDIEPAEWDDLLAVNLRSVLFGCQAVFPHMRDRGWGRIMNLSSVAGLRGGPQVQGAHYATSKAGIIGLGRYLAYEMAPYGIAVNTLAPGPIQTEQTALAPPDKLAAVSKTIPLGRLGTVSEVGGLAVYLASDEGGFVVGATLDVNGGIVMR
jgi:3-oxoacyl-[acyl-carrier protein] reductase